MAQSQSRVAKPPFATRQLNKLKKIPAELLPLFSVVGLGLVFGVVAGTHKLITDPSIRRTRENSRGKREPGAGGH